MPNTIRSEDSRGLPYQNEFWCPHCREQISYLQYNVRCCEYGTVNLTESRRPSPANHSVLIRDVDPGDEDMDSHDDYDDYIRTCPNCERVLTFQELLWENPNPNTAQSGPATESEETPNANDLRLKSVVEKSRIRREQSPDGWNLLQMVGTIPCQNPKCGKVFVLSTNQISTLRDYVRFRSSDNGTGNGSQTCECPSCGHYSGLQDYADQLRKQFDIHI